MLTSEKMVALAGLIIVSLVASAAVASQVEWKEKETKVDDKVSAVVVSCFGLFPSLEYKLSPSNRIVVKYPKQYGGKQYSVDFAQMADTLVVSVLPEGHKPSHPDDVGSIAINALQIVIDLIKMSKGSEYPYFVIQLPEKFRGSVRVKPVL